MNHSEYLVSLTSYSSRRPTVNASAGTRMATLAEPELSVTRWRRSACASRSMCRDRPRNPISARS